MRRRDLPLVLLAAVTAGVAFGRFTVPTRPSQAFGWPLTYEAIAHVSWGAMAGGALCCWLLGRAVAREGRLCDRFFPLLDIADEALLFAVCLAAGAGVLLLVELGAFVAGGGLR